MVPAAQTETYHGDAMRMLQLPLGWILTAVCLCLWALPHVQAAQSVELAELDGLSYSSNEFLATLESLSDDAYRRVLANENEARNALKLGLLDKHFAQQARQHGLHRLPLVKDALMLLREEVLIDWYVQSNVDPELVASVKQQLPADLGESIADESGSGAVEYRLQQAFVARDEPNARALITSIASDLENNQSQLSFAQVLQSYLNQSEVTGLSAQGRVTKADFNMGWHELADIELRFRPFVESSSAGDIFGPLRLESGWIFLTVVDKRAARAAAIGQSSQMISMREARKVREGIVAALTQGSTQANAANPANAAPPLATKDESLTASVLTTPVLGTLTAASAATVVQQLGGLFTDLARLSVDPSESGEPKGSNWSDESLTDHLLPERVKAWQQRRQHHRQFAQQAWEALGSEPPAAVLARLTVAQDRFLSQVQVRALATAQTQQAQVTDEALARIYQQNIDRFYVPAQVKIRQIFLASSTHSPQEIEAINAQVQLNPQEFDAIALRIDASESNIGADGLGKPIALPQLDPTLFKALLSLEIGQISAPITSGRGTHIVILDRFTPAALKARDDVKSTLMNLARDELMLAEERRLTAALKQKVVVY